MTRLRSLTVSRRAAALSPCTATAAVLACTLAVSACATATARTTAPARAVIAPPGVTLLAAYSPAIRTGDLVFLSGQVGLRPGARELVPGGIAEETRQALENVRTILDAAGLTPREVVKCTVFLADMAEYEPMNRVYAAFFGGDPPARSAVGVAALPLAARVEIECIAAARAP
jgi:2-iminobutanoate/2-iminopropanoate deaminase